jgi:hypothetical protein
MTERDGAWIARVIARFTDADLATIAGIGKFTDPAQTALLAGVLSARRDRILRRYFARVSPVTDLAVSGDDLCGVDLARRSGLFPAAAFAYQAHALGGSSPRVAAEADGKICLTLAHRPGLTGRRDDDPERYVIVRLGNGQASGRLRAHLYDLGPERGFALVGIEREAP